jgi:hypothetical protein
VKKGRTAPARRAGLPPRGVGGAYGDLSAAMLRTRAPPTSSSPLRAGARTTARPTRRSRPRRGRRMRRPLGRGLPGRSRWPSAEAGRTLEVVGRQWDASVPEGSTGDQHGRRLRAGLGHPAPASPPRPSRSARDHAFLRNRLSARFGA